MALNDWLRLSPQSWRKNERGILSFLHIIQQDADNWIVDIRLPDVPGNAYGAFFKNKTAAFRYALDFMKKYKKGTRWNK